MIVLWPPAPCMLKALFGNDGYRLLPPRGGLLIQKKPP